MTQRHPCGLDEEIPQNTHMKPYYREEYFPRDLARWNRKEKNQFCKTWTSAKEIFDRTNANMIDIYHKSCPRKDEMDGYCTRVPTEDEPCTLSEMNNPCSTDKNINNLIKKKNNFMNCADKRLLYGNWRRSRFAHSFNPFPVHDWKDDSKHEHFRNFMGHWTNQCADKVEERLKAESETQRLNDILAKRSMLDFPTLSSTPTKTKRKKNQTRRKPRRSRHTRRPTRIAKRRSRRTRKSASRKLKER